MATKLDERQHYDRDDQPDPNDPLENLYHAPSADPSDLPPNHPDHEASPEESDTPSPDTIKANEEEGNKPQAANAAQRAEERGLAHRMGLQGDSLATFQRLQGKLLSFKLTNQNKAAGGIGSVLLLFGVLMFVGVGSVELIHVRENAIGFGNRLANSVFDRRGSRSFTRLMRQMNRGARINPQNTIIEEKFQKKFEREGFRAVFTEVDGGRRLTEFTYEQRNADGSVTNRSFDFSNPDFNAAFSNFTDGEFGEVIHGKIRTVMTFRASTWKGRAARALWQKMRVRFRNWPDRRPSDAADTDREKFSENLRAEQSSQDNEEVSNRRSGELGEGEFDDSSALVDGAEEYEEGLLSDPSTTDDQLIDGALDSETVDRLNGVAGNALGEAAAGASEQTIRQTLGDLVTRLPSTAAGGALTGISVTDWHVRACRVLGTLRFVGSVRNVVLSYQLAKLALKFLTVADHQKAGVLSSDGLKLVMQYLHTPNPANGRGYYQSGGVQNLVGNSAARVSAASLARFSVSRDNPGLMGDIENFLTNAPLVGLILHTTACRVTNNGIVQFAGAVVGIAVAIFGGSETGLTQTQIAVSVGLSIAEEVAFQISKPLMLKAATGQVLNGQERNGELAGDAIFGSGTGALFGITNNANGLRPTTKAQARRLAQLAEEDHRRELADKSIFERYFSTQDSNSAVTKAYFASPKNLASIMMQLPKLAQPLQIASGVLANAMPRQVAYAQEVSSDQCKDKWIEEQQLATDAFCNVVVATFPELDIDETERILIEQRQITPEGNPVPESDYHNYLMRCHSGQSSVVYRTQISDSGTDDPRDSTCLTPGQPYPGDTIGRRDRFTAYYGYFIDEANISEDINDEYKNIDPLQVAAPSPSAPTGPTDVVSGGPCVARTVTDNDEDPDSDEVVSIPTHAGTVIELQDCEFANRVREMLDAAAAEGVILTGGGWRNGAQQIALRRAHCGTSNYAIYEMPSGQCSPPTARPGTSRHERGLAIDFNNCSSRGTRCYQWLDANADRWGIQNLPREPWHWSIDGH